jgi:hypothetical protein
VQGVEAVVGRQGTPALEDADDVVLDVRSLGLRQAEAAGLEEGGALLECFGVGVDGALGLALGSQGPLEGADKWVYLGSALALR